MEYMTKIKTYEHIYVVRNYMGILIKNLIDRSTLHDKSKLESPEVEIFDKYTSQLRSLIYGSKEYQECLKNMKTALDHHYKFNSHHPEYYNNGINGMTLIDLIEMLCDWMAAVLRHETGDIEKSLKINSKRFNISPQLVEIFKNTINFIEKEVNDG